MNFKEEKFVKYNTQVSYLNNCKDSDIFCWEKYENIWKVLYLPPIPYTLTSLCIIFVIYIRKIIPIYFV